MLHVFYHNKERGGQRERPPAHKWAGRQEVPPADATGSSQSLPPGILPKIQLDCTCEVNYQFIGKTKGKTNISNNPRGWILQNPKWGTPKEPMTQFLPQEKSDKEENKRVGEESDFKRLTRPMNQMQCIHRVWWLKQISYFYKAFGRQPGTLDYSWGFRWY